MERTRHPAVALQFANVADIHQNDIAAAVQLDRLFDGKRLYLAFGRIDQRLAAKGDVLGPERSDILWWQSHCRGQGATLDGRWFAGENNRPGEFRDVGGRG
jgi:hypothetical protein